MNAQLADRFQRAVLLEALSAAGADVSKPSAIRCPFHDDKHPSAGVYQDEAGVWRYKCQTPTCGVGGDVYDIRARVKGTSVGDELKASGDPIPIDRAQPKRTWPTLEALAAGLNTTAKFLYTNPDTGEVELAVFRIEEGGGRKTFRQASPYRGQWAMQAPPKPWPLYNRSRVRQADVVVVVEGEKCVHALHPFGIVATTCPAGAGKSGLADWSPLAGKRVVLWPDNDETGLAHMQEVAKHLQALEPTPIISTIDPADLNLPPKGDAVEFIAASEHPREELSGLLDNAEPAGASREVRDLIEETIAGKRRNLPLPWKELSRSTNLLVPGTITVLCGDPGCSKSFWLMQLFTFLHSSGVKIDLFELEDDRPYHLYRALVQKCGDTNLFDDEWVQANPDKARYYNDQHAAFFDSFGPRVCDAPAEAVTHEAMLGWIRERCARGSVVLGIDPITAIEATDKPWLADQQFITEARKILRATGSRLILVSHPKKGSKGSSTLDDLAGGTAYVRFTDTVLWLEKHDEPRDVKVRSPFGSIDHTTNRSVRIRKARKGRGGGWTVAIRFCGKTATFEELGIEVKE